MDTQIEGSPDLDLELILIIAASESLNRHTHLHLSRNVQRCIQKRMQWFSDAALRCIADDIADAKAGGVIDAKADEYGWLPFMEEIREEQRKRRRR